MRNSIELFDTNEDWLSQEIERESHISAWDLDEGQSVRKEHADNCDAQSVAAQHRAVHRATQQVIPRNRNSGQRGDDSFSQNRVLAIIFLIVGMLFPPLIILSIYYFAKSGRDNASNSKQ